MPQAVVDELGGADLEPLLLARDVALERDALEVAVRGDERQRRRALVDLAALDADPPVLDHVDAAEPVRADDRAEPVDELDEPERLAVERDRDAAVELDDDLARLRAARRVGAR